jgi:hypothetical protein
MQERNPANKSASRKVLLTQAFPVVAKVLTISEHFGR